MLWTQQLRSLDLKIEVSDPIIQNMFNHKNENGQISTPTARQKLSSWEIKDLGEIYLFLLALTPKLKLWTQK